MKVLLTGAFGTLGRATLLTLAQRGHDVLCFDLPTRRNRRWAKQLNVAVHWGDIRNPDDLQGAVLKQDAVIHQAAVLPPFTERYPDVAEAINVGGTQTLIEQLENSNKDSILVYPSSITVHGLRSGQTEPVNASGPLQATDRYSAHKIACEARIQSSQLQWSIQRVGVALNPDDRDATPDAFRTLFETDPMTRMEYVHPADVACAQVSALACEEALGRVLLIGGGPSCQIHQKELFAAIYDAMGLRLPPAEAFGRAAFYTDWMDTAESEELLHYQSRSFEEYRQALIHSLRHWRRALWPLRRLAEHLLLRYSGPWQRRHTLRP